MCTTDNNVLQYLVDLAIEQLITQQDLLLFNSK